MSKESHWKVLAVFIGKDPTPQVFPAVQVSARPVGRYDKSFKDTVAYTRGYVDNRDDHTGKTFKPIMHTPDRLVTTFIRLEQDAAASTAVIANNADKEAYGKLAAPMGAFVTHKSR